jgi:hypothetical protein
MKISEVDAKVIQAIESAKQRLMDATGRGKESVSVELENSFYAVLSWSATVFYPGSENISRRGDDLEEVVSDMLAKHARREKERANGLHTIRELAEKLGVKVEVLA